MTKKDIYNKLSRVLTDYENNEASEGELYRCLVEIQNNWEDTITAEEMNGKPEQLLGSIYEIEDSNGNTLCTFQININGDPKNMVNCSHADTDDTIRIQIEEK